MSRNVIIILHILLSHIAFFPENLKAVSEDKVERHYPDIKVMENRHQRRWYVPNNHG